MANKPIDAVILPVPLIKPVTVPNDLLFPWTDGCEAKSAATADVMILLGLCFTKDITKNVRICLYTKCTSNANRSYPPTRIPIQPSIAKRATGGMPASE